jgi:hypothetical protein
MVITSLRQRLERYFEFRALGANWRTEILAGCTTFMTMAYIVFVNPAILHETGMPLAALTAATCVSAAVGSFLMGGLARYPIALAPGMGLNAYFTYSVVKGMGVPWQTALGAVFISGAAFLLLTLLGVRQLIISTIPFELYAAVAAGVGLFIALIGFRNSGIIVPDQATTVTLGNLHQPATALALFGLVLMAALLAWRVRAAMLIGILATTGLGLATGVARWTPQAYRLSDLSATAGKLDIGAALRIGFLEIVFVFLFIDLFDNIGTLVAVGKKANLFDKTHQIPRCQSHPDFRRHSHHGGRVDRHLHGGELYRERRGRGRRRPHRHRRHRDRAAVRGSFVRGAGGGRHSARGHRSSTDRGGQPDDGSGGRNRMERPGGGHPRVPHHYDHPLDVQHRQRPGLRLYSLYAHESRAREIQPGKLVRLRADGAVHRAFYVLVAVR